ncbi:MAG: hypothetical protein A3H68_00475 [Candidatus Taylorbacteria bacterium RIFCSPLOWO2_02_FULL_46_40]|uniref:LamG-like jellyroll fold domain-containing protein n=1 Tax=Candidatus Taylorbacteria bacterium RIFCSPLOWO2_02_FULL_46_40 TaxID=1802329 RepID=A0A1G2P4D4_9BACT|nr:MAG: hypothetical protein A3H68_00475 [Candidatus Taylorbacteria bacterium RIFCSPLOWO2_02_FULL_46_40]
MTLNHSLKIYIPFSILFFAFCIFSAPQTVNAGTINVPSNFLTLNSGLVGWWTFDGKNMAQNVADSSGLNNNGYMSGFTSTSTAVTPGKIGQALKFDGVNDYVRAGDIGVDENQSSLTVSFWAKVNSLTRGEYLVSRYGSGPDLWYFGHEVDNDIAFYTYTAITSTSGYMANGFSATNVWHHIVGVYDGVRVRIYVNGVLGTKNQGSLTGNTNTGVTAPLVIGTFTTATGFASGSLDDVRIYNRALSASEISQLYNATKGSKVEVSNAGGNNLQNGLVGWWTFDGKDTPWTSATAATAIDKSGNGKTGTLTNMSRTTATTPGKIGQALKFDGVNDYINLGSTNNYITRTIPFSISFWLNLRGYTANNNKGLAIFKTTEGSPYEIFVSNNASYSPISFGSQDGTYIRLHPSTDFGSTLDSKWNYITITFDGVDSSAATSFKIFVNGDIKTLTTSLAYAPQTNQTFLGGLSTSAVAKMFLDDVRIYNRALSATEIRQLYNMGR